MQYRLLVFAFVSLSCYAEVALGADPSLVIDPGGCTRVVKQLIFTATGKQLVSVGDDKVIRVWDVATGKTLRTIRDQVSVCVECQISAMALSPDNKYLAVGGKFPGVDAEARFAIYIYNFETGQRSTLLKGHRAKVTALAFSPSGTQLASGSFVREGERATDVAGAVRTWKLGPTGWERSRVLPEHEDQVASVAFSPDESQLVSAGHDTKVVLWNLNSNSSSPLQVMTDHSDIVYGAAFSPDGRLIISGGADRKVYVWDAQGKLSREFSEQPNAITSLEISPNKDRLRVLVGFENGASRILSGPDGKIVADFEGGGDKVYTGTFSGIDDNIVATSGGFNGEIWIRQADDPKSARLLGGKGQTIWKVGFSEKGDSIAFGTEHTGDAPNGYGQLKQIIRLKSDILSSISQRNSGYKISLGGTVGTGAKYYSEIEETKGEGNATYELKTRFGETVPRRVGDKLQAEPIRLSELLVFRDKQKFKEIKRTHNTGRTHRAFTFTPDGRYIISAGEDGYLALYETKNPSEPLHLFTGHTGDVWSVAVSPDGRFIVSGSSDQTIKLWHINSEQYLVSFFVASDSEWIAWTPQGYYTSSFRGDRYIGWQVQETDDKQPAFYAAQQFARVFNRPEVVSRYLEVPDIKEAVRETPFIATAQQTGIDRTTVFSGQVLLKSLPPRIQIISPADATTTFSQRIMPLKVLVTSANLPITEVTVSLNGFVKGNYQGGGSKKLEIETTIALKPKENTLVVVAANEHARSKPETRTIFYDQPPPRGVPGQVKPIPVKGQIQSDRGNTHVQPPRQYAGEFVPAFLDAGANDYWNLPTELVTYAAPVAPDDTPTFKILSPAETPPVLRTTNDYLPMEILIETVGPNTKLRVLVNGAERHKEDVTTGETSRAHIPLDEGENTVTVVTTTNGVDSAPQERRVNYVYEDVKPKLVFLGVGISGYSHLTPPLQYGHKDAEDLAQLLKKLENGPIFGKVLTETLTNGKATHREIIKAVRTLNEQAKSEKDVRVVLISGHGGTYPKELPEYYLFAKEQTPGTDPELAESANWDTIMRRLLESEINYGQGTLVMFVDTCRAGLASPNISNASKRVGGYVFFGSSGPDQQSIERDGNGVFTKAVLEGLGGKADYDKDGKIDNTELTKWLSCRLNELNEDQKLQHDPASELKLFYFGHKTESTPSNGRCERMPIND